MVDIAGVHIGRDGSILGGQLVHDGLAGRAAAGHQVGYIVLRERGYYHYTLASAEDYLVVLKLFVVNKLLLFSCPLVLSNSECIL